MRSDIIPLSGFSDRERQKQGSVGQYFNPREMMEVIKLC